MKKSFVLAALLLVAPAFATAEPRQPVAKKSSVATSRPAAKAAAKPAAKQQQQQRLAKATTKSRGRKPPAPVEPTNRDELHSMAAQLAAGQRAADRALTPAELALADRVQLGRMPCELGNVVTLVADPRSPGHFNLELQKMRFRMTPVESNTGAIRLEDQQAGAVWLQLGNKSMLMNQRMGQRLADECQSPEQIQMAESLKRTPGLTLFDAAPAAAVAATAAAETAVPLAATKETARQPVTTAVARRSKQRQ